MALLAKTKKTMESTGRNIPIPFSEICISPGIIRVQYTKNPSKTKFNIIFKRPKTNWSFRFLNIKIEIRANNPERANRITNQVVSTAKTSISCLVFHKGNQKTTAGFSKTTNIKYRLCTL